MAIKLLEVIPSWKRLTYDTTYPKRKRVLKLYLDCVLVSAIQIFCLIRIIFPSNLDEGGLAQWKCNPKLPAGASDVFSCPKQ